MNFAVLADHSVRIKEIEKIDTYFDLAREQQQKKKKKEAAEHEGDGNTSCSCCTWSGF